jgi:hypothetical protein
MDTIKRKMLLVFSHKLTQAQIQDAKDCLKVEEFVSLPEDLQKIWSNIDPILPPRLQLKEIEDWINNNATPDDYILIQGDFGATFYLVDVVKEKGLTAVYSTTERKVIEVHEGDEVHLKHTFKHIRFAEYERCCENVNIEDELE